MSITFLGSRCSFRGFLGRVKVEDGIKFIYWSVLSCTYVYPSSSEEEEEEILYCYAVGIPSKIDEEKLGSIKSWYQIPDDLNPRLVV